MWGGLLPQRAFCESKRAEGRTLALPERAFVEGGEPVKLDGVFASCRHVLDAKATGIVERSKRGRTT